MRIMSRALIAIAACLALMTSARAGERRAPDAAGDFQSLLEPYFRLQSALVEDRIDTVEADAAELVRRAATLGEAGKPIRNAAAELRTSTDLASARAAFGKLSDVVIAYSERTKVSRGAGVARMYCPMLKKSWLQKGEEIKNPYYGKAMLDCGVKKTVD